MPNAAPPYPAAVSVPVLLAMLVLILASVAPARSQAGDDSGSGKACIFRTPKGWEKQPIKWIGGCINSYADGFGALQRLENGEVAEAFYGKMESGSLKLGVIDGGSGYIAGRFKDGAPERSGDRDTETNAYNAASRAASELADFYSREGDKASAQFYKDQSRKFASQTD